MTIVGISGAIGSGKSTLARLLTEQDAAHAAHLETSTVIIELARAFNQALARHTDELTTDELSVINGVLEAILPQVSVLAGRDLKLDDIVVRQDEANAAPEWYEKLFAYCRQVQGEPSLASTAITAENKADYRALLQWLGGYFLYKLDEPLLWYKELKRRIDTMPADVTFVALTAPRQPAEATYVQSIGGKVVLIERPDLQSDRTDVTERRVTEIVPDVRIINDGSLEALAGCAAALRQDLIANREKPVYRAAAFVKAASGSS